MAHTKSKNRGPSAWQILESAGPIDDLIVVHRGRKAVAVILPIRDSKLVSDLEDWLDVRAARAALREKGPTIPFEQVKRKLNLG